MKESVQERFWRFVNKDGPIPEHVPLLGQCWIWTGAVVDEYGRYKWKDRSRRAHRVAWELSGHSISSTDLLLHECDNPTCVNPAHLRIGSQHDNMQERWRKERGKAKDTRFCRIWIKRRFARMTPGILESMVQRCCEFADLIYSNHHGNPASLRKMGRPAPTELTAREVNSPK